MDVVFIDDNQYATSFTDYLKKNNGKFVAVISPNQYAIEIEKDFSHEGMLADLIRRTRPDMKMDNWGNALDPNNDFRNDTIAVLGYPGYMQIELPLKQYINPSQYKALHEILTAIIEYNKQVDKNYSGQKYEILAFGFGLIDIEAKYYKDNINELIDKIIPYVTDNPYEIDEVIIGKSFKENKNDIDSINNILKKRDNEFILDNDIEVKTKGYGYIMLLIFITSLVSMIILVLGVFVDLN